MNSIETERITYPMRRNNTNFDPFLRFKETWKRSLLENSSTLPHEFPNYYLSNPECLVSTATVKSFCIGTGASIFLRSLLPAIAAAKHEVILVTCFWARGPTLDALRETLEKLAEYRRELIRSIRSTNTGLDALPPLKIRICFSSRSLFQKLFHPSSKDGYVYPPSTWPARLGLPSQEVLEAGLIDLRVKSLFFLPFSVMHPKFLIVDRERAWLPSCNVSWEDWFEGCVEVAGDAVTTLVEFYRHVWDKQLESHLPDGDGLSPDHPQPLTLAESVQVSTSRNHPSTLENFVSDIETPAILLPSSHHCNPRFDLIPWHNHPPPPSTPLNTAVLQLLYMAEHTVYMQTPNLTSAMVIDKLLEALERGVNVTIVTNARLMLLEQLVTAGTTTSRCLNSLISRYKRLKSQNSLSTSNDNPENSSMAVDIEAQQPQLGVLNVYYYRPNSEGQTNVMASEPVQSHLKLTIIDTQYVVLGSGNMDRASWFTSQELGILFHSKDFATALENAVFGILDSRRESVFLSDELRD
ncbi:phospholipase D/nuclease [Daldinia caldariorum]|uniref:phospholipase D/nuclease n=1 Tax=Daldinia caldariorum TaxID=326644 RepID=UPI00200795DA|nr:phospholipase D/nuclease [Daldinia caldariorum]KAI1463377.1 phospholipase D/nuclease [Daldinia caldariorum]